MAKLHGEHQKEDEEVELFLLVQRLVLPKRFLRF
jgi:hypothetical protein